MTRQKKKDMTLDESSDISQDMNWLNWIRRWIEVNISTCCSEFGSFEKINATEFHRNSDDEHKSSDIFHFGDRQLLC